jgi:hypothetical protein
MMVQPAFDRPQNRAAEKGNEAHAADQQKEEAIKARLSTLLAQMVPQEAFGIRMHAYCSPFGW